MSEKIRKEADEYIGEAVEQLATRLYRNGVEMLVERNLRENPMKELIIPLMSPRSKFAITIAISDAMDQERSNIAEYVDDAIRELRESIEASEKDRKISSPDTRGLTVDDAEFNTRLDRHIMKLDFALAQMSSLRSKLDQRQWTRSTYASVKD